MYDRTAMARRLRFLALTSSACGLKVSGSILLSGGTPFMLSCGFDGSGVALVSSIAAICGSFVQPYFGVLSDRRRQRGGGRLLLLVGSAVATSLALIAFSTSQMQARWLAQLFSQPLDSTLRLFLNKVFYVTWYSVFNVSLMPLQMASRAIIIENSSTEDQVIASAWASINQGFGYILGFGLGAAPLTAFMPFGRDATHFTILSVLGSTLIIMTTLITASVATENSRPVDSKWLSDGPGKKNFSERIKGLLKEVSTVPRPLWRVFAIQFLAWMGWFPFRTYYTSWLASEIVRNDAVVVFDVDFHTYAARLGSLAGIYFSIVGLVANCTLPSLVSWLDSVSDSSRRNSRTPIKALMQVWLSSHIYTAFALCIAGIIATEAGAISLVASIGLPWAVTLWVPFALMGIILSREREDHLNSGRDYEPPKMGVAVGLHNSAYSIPQILSALICHFVFKVANNDSLGNIMALLTGGCWMIVAAFASWVFFPDLL